MALSIEIKVPQAVLFDQERGNKIKKKEIGQTGTKAILVHSSRCSSLFNLITVMVSRRPNTLYERSH